MSIFITGMIIGGFLYLLGRAMEANERRARERWEREELMRRVREGHR